MRVVELNNVIFRSPSILSGVLDLLKALWESGAQFIYILEKLRSSRTFWENLSCCIRAAFASYPIDSVETVDEKKSLRYGHSALAFHFLHANCNICPRVLLNNISFKI